MIEELAYGLAELRDLTSDRDRAAFARLVCKKAQIHEGWVGQDIVTFMDVAEIPEDLRWDKYLEKPDV